MGAGMSARQLEVAGKVPVSDRTQNLDKYGGADRPAVKRGQSFDKAMNWLGDGVKSQADQLQEALLDPSQHVATPVQAFVADGSPKKDTKVAQAHQRSTQKAAQRAAESGSSSAATGSVPGYMRDTKAISAAPSEGTPGWVARLSSSRRHEAQRAAATAARTGHSGAKPKGTKNPKNAPAATGGRARKGEAQRKGKTSVAKKAMAMLSLKPVEDKSGNWRGHVVNAKKKAYLTMKVYLRLRLLGDYAVPDAFKVDAARCIMSMLSQDWAKFTEQQRRYFRTPSTFAVLGGPSGFNRSKSVRVVDLDDRDGEYRNLGLDVVQGSESDSDDEAGGSAVAPEPKPKDRPRMMLEMLTRKSNAAWVEKSSWEAPSTFEIHNHTLSVERGHYNHKAKQLLKKGRIAFHFLAAGEEVVTPDGRTMSCITSDPWHLIETCCPNKMPCGSRAEGLPPLSRQILQLVNSVHKSVGQDAVDSLVIVLHVGEQEEDMVATLLREHDFYGLDPEQIYLVTQDRQFGYKYEKKYDELMEANESELRLPGTGHAYLQLLVRGATCCWDGSHMEPMQESMMDVFKRKGVAWFMSVRMMDLHWCGEQGHTDLDFFGLALKLHETAGANMIVEAAPCGSVMELRQNNSIIMTRNVGSSKANAACDVAFGDCLTMKIQNQITLIADAGEKTLFTSMRRYLFYLPELEGVLMERTTFRSDIIMQGGYAYLEFDQADLTSGPKSRCSVIVQRPGKPKAPPATKVVELRWLHSIAELMSKQDKNDDFCQRAMASQSRIAPVGVARKPYIGEQSLRIVLFVADNSASRKALRLAKVLMQNDANFLRIATVVSSQQGLEYAEELLMRYQNLLGVVPSNQLVTEVVMRRSGTTVDTLQDYVTREQTDLVIMGSEKLGDEHPMGSVTLAALKSMKISMLVIKSDTCGNGVKEEVDRKKRSERLSLRCMVSVNHPSRAAMRFTMGLMDPITDKLFLAKPTQRMAGLGIPEDPNADKRLLESFQDAASAKHFKTQIMTADGNAAIALTRIALENNCDILTIRRTRGKLPAEVEEVIRQAKTAVLVFDEEDASSKNLTVTAHSSDLGATGSDF